MSRFFNLIFYKKNEKNLTNKGGGHYNGAIGYLGAGRQGKVITAKDYVFEICSKNPARPNETTIKYSTVRETQAKVTLYDVSGRQVKTLLNGTVKPGSHTLTFDSKDLATGVYLIRFEAGEIKATKKLILIK